MKATIIGSNPAATDTFRSDSLKSYEFGYKGSWLQDRVNAAVSGYHIDWHRMQLETYLLGNGVIENTGNAQIDGVQAQASWRTDHWNISGGAAYNNARTVQVDPLGSIQKGAQLPYSAKRTLTLAVDYHWRFGRNPAHVGANFHATSHRNAGFTGDSSDPNFSMPGYGMLNLDGGVTLDGGKGVAIDLFLRNAFNRRVPIGTLNSLTINFLASLGGPMLVTLSQPRTVGINITVPFGHTDKH